MSLVLAEKRYALSTIGSFAIFIRDIKLAHSLFALPFALSSLAVLRILPTVSQVVWILVAIVGARSFAMGMNRYLDREIDRQNPRTSKRALPSGGISERQMLLWTGAFGILFCLAAFQLSPLAGLLSVPLLAVLATYSVMKRYSWMSHWYLGICLGLAPIAVQVALQNQASVAIILLGGAVAMWTAGFDLLYSLQDQEFDRHQGLKSVPARFGPRTTLWLSRLSFATMCVLLACVLHLTNMGWIAWLGLGTITLLVTIEHYMVRDAMMGDTRGVQAAFFPINAWISMLFFAAVLLDRTVGVLLT